VLCARGYPVNPDPSHYPIRGLEEAAKMEGVAVFHAGTISDGIRYYTASGRVVDITAIGETLEIALDRAYGVADMITFEGKYFRRDIGRYSLL
jgi:phosphoribosylamine--glycine ligase